MSTSESTPSPSTTSLFDLTDPLYAVEHLARLFRLEVDSVRELTFRNDFPQPIKVGRRWLWFSDEVLPWARQQPRFSTAQRKRNAEPVEDPTAHANTIKDYRGRAKKDRGRAA